MKIINDLVVLDLETTASEDEKGFQKNDWIIQVGAVYLKKTEDRKGLEKVGTFDKLVQPQEPISQFIEELTGVTQEAVNQAPMFDVVGQEFLDWTRSFGNPKQLRICCWGNYFDMPVLRKNYEAYGFKMPFSGTAFDIKTYASLWMMLSGRRADKLSVEHVARIMGIEPSGKYHNALVDAETEADILLRIFDDLDGGVFIDSELFKFTRK